MTGFAASGRRGRRAWRDMARELRHQWRENRPRRHGPGLWSLIFLPFRLIFWLIGTILGLVGRLVGVILGFVLIVVGVLISLTIVGAIVGVPLALIGVLVVLKSLF